ncbi:MAG: dockerin type I domain-containing protein, partial [Planctomycetota bacterium]|nr:dockerin type I domain-containing protein [Planctomycetota bacterium]
RTAGAPAGIDVNENSANSLAVPLGLSGLAYAPGPANEVGQSLTYRITSIPPSITVWLADGKTQVPAGTTFANPGLPTLQGLKYKTVANASGTGNLTWTVTDDGSSLAPNVNILAESLTIAVKNVPPVANPDPSPGGTLTTLENTPLQIFVYANDTGFNGVLDLTFVPNSGPSHGSVSFSNGVVTYTPALGFPDPSQGSGQDSFRYTIKDNDGLSSNEATVTVTVIGVPVIVVPAYHNPTTPWDVSNDGQVSPLDALIVINFLNTYPYPAPGGGSNLPPHPVPPTQYYWDVNDDGRVTAEDVLEVIVRLNTQNVSSGEGEAGAVSSPTQPTDMVAAGENVVADPTTLFAAPDNSRLAPWSNRLSAAVQPLPAQPFRAVAGAPLPVADLRSANLFDRLGAPDASLADLTFEDILSEIASDIGGAQGGQSAEDWALSGLTPHRRVN